MKRILPIWLGNTIEAMGILVGIGFLFSINLMAHPVLRFITTLASMVCFWYFPHCLSHFIIGRALGIRFTHYRITKSSLAKLKSPFFLSLLLSFPTLGLVIDKNSLSRTVPLRRAMMHSSGVIASMLLPAIPLIYSLSKMPSWVNLLLFFLFTFNLFFSLYASSKAGDLRRARRALKMVRDGRS